MSDKENNNDDVLGGKLVCVGDSSKRMEGREGPTGTVEKTLQTLKQNAIRYLGSIAKSKLVIRHVENLISGMSSAFLYQKYTYKIYQRFCSHRTGYNVLAGSVGESAHVQSELLQGC